MAPQFVFGSSRDNKRSKEGPQYSSGEAEASLDDRGHKGISPKGVACWLLHRRSKGQILASKQGAVGILHALSTDHWLTKKFDRTLKQCCYGAALKRARQHSSLWGTIMLWRRDDDFAAEVRRRLLPSVFKRSFLSPLDRKCPFRFPLFFLERRLSDRQSRVFAQEALRQQQPFWQESEKRNVAPAPADTRSDCAIVYTLFSPSFTPTRERKGS